MKGTNMIRKICLMLLAICLIAEFGCRIGAVNLKIRYDRIEGLKQGDRVIFEQNQIGTVTGVVYTATGRYEVDAAIKAEFADAATEYSEFFIVSDPQAGDRKAIEIIQTKKGGTPLKDGAVIEGSTRTSAVFNLFRNKLNKGLEDITQQFNQFMKDLSGISESEAIRKLEDELNRLGDEINKSGKSVQEKIQKEILPEIQKEIDKLREQLQKFGREEEVRPLEEQMDKMKEI